MLPDNGCGAEEMPLGLLVICTGEVEFKTKKYAFHYSHIIPPPQKCNAVSNIFAVMPKGFSCMIQLKKELYTFGYWRPWDWILILYCEEWS